MEEKHESEDGSQPDGGTGQRQDHRAAPPGHRIPDEPPNLEDPAAADQSEEDPEAAGSESD